MSENTNKSPTFGPHYECPPGDHYHCRLCNRVVSKAVYDGEEHCICFSDPAFNPCLEYGQQPDLLTGRKADNGKLRWDLLPESTENVVKVLTFGARKYAPENWRKVEGARWRYYSAAIRHMWAWWRGEKLDPESGLPHLAHAACCILFLDALDPK